MYHCHYLLTESGLCSLITRYCEYSINEGGSSVVEGLLLNSIILEWHVRAELFNSCNLHLYIHFAACWLWHVSWHGWRLLLQTQRRYDSCQVDGSWGCFVQEVHHKEWCVELWDGDVRDMVTGTQAIWRHLSGWGTCVWGKVIHTTHMWCSASLCTVIVIFIIFTLSWLCIQCHNIHIIFSWSNCQVSICMHPATTRAFTGTAGICAYVCML